jgi:hypothetical protein
MQVLNFYEGTEYEKRETEVWIGKENTNAIVYVWKAGLDYLETKDWDENEFRDRFLQVYLDKIIPETLNELKRFDLDF